tara:strand:- start:1363 stop:1554 length:192 start_codon:yes stop_codon:yes gene_type:complete
MYKEVEEVQKQELVNELIFLTGLKESVWMYHPDNPNASSIVDEYNQLQKEMESIEEKINQLDI